jgi:hypothetical protein
MGDQLGVPVRVIISPSDQQFSDENDETVKLAHWVKVLNDDGTEADAGYGFENLSHALDFAHAVAVGVRAAGKRVEVFNVEF